jgi:DNA-binding TFAR19-related protein (PDSD5 family)
MARSGQIRGKVGEKELIDILDQVNGSISAAPSKIKVERGLLI